MHFQAVTSPSSGGDARQYKTGLIGGKITMSTKASIEYGTDFHFYEEMMEGRCELSVSGRRLRFAVEPDRMCVALPADFMRIVEPRLLARPAVLHGPGYDMAQDEHGRWWIEVRAPAEYFHLERHGGASHITFVVPWRLAQVLGNLRERPRGWGLGAWGDVRGLARRLARTSATAAGIEKPLPDAGQHMRKPGQLKRR